MVWIDGIGCVELGVEFLPDGPDGSIVKLMKCQQGDDVFRHLPEQYHICQYQLQHGCSF